MKRRQKVRRGLILVSFFLFPATFFYFSPAIIIMAANSRVINGSFIMFASLFVSAMLLGRAFCGWVCPGAGCQEALFAANDREVKKGDIIKWVIWIPWIIAIAVVAVRAGGYEKV
ncbi:4Fe-4S binding protein, partial [Gemmatimonadota bacterium]